MDEDACFKGEEFAEDDFDVEDCVLKEAGGFLSDSEGKLTSPSMP